MKKTLLIIIFLMTGIYLFAQTKNDLLELKLNGKVKSLKEIEIDTVFGVGKVGDTIKKRIIFFNEKGNKNEMDEYWYRSTTDLSNGTLNRKDITKYNDKGNINEIETYSYKPDGTLNNKIISKYNYNDKGNMFEKDTYNSSVGLIEKDKYQYDNKMNMIEWDCYNAQGSLTNKETYKYDDKGNKIEKDIYSYTAVFSAKERKDNYILKGSFIDSTCKYNDKGYKIEESTYDYNSDGSLHYKYIFTYNYDDKGNKIAVYSNKTTNDSEKPDLDHPSYKNTYKYDDKGNMIEMEAASAGIKNIYKYDDKGNKIEEEPYSGNSFKRTWQYDDKGNEIEADEYLGGGTLNEKCTHKYDYDKTGNWIKLIKMGCGSDLYPNNHRIQCTIEREIVYY